MSISGIHEHNGIDSGLSEAESSDGDDEFEDQGSSSNDESSVEVDDETDDEEMISAEVEGRRWRTGVQRGEAILKAKESGEVGVQQYLHTDDLSSDDEDGDVNTIGRVPLHWYDAYDHIGYDISGEKVLKRTGKDRLDIAISNRDESHSNLTVYDMYNDREVVLTERDLEIIRRVQAGAYAHPEFVDTPDYSDYFSSIIEIMPLSAQPEPKRRFLPSKWEMMRIVKIAKAIKEGKYISIQDKIQQSKEKESNIYMIWKEDKDEILEENKRFKFHLPAPKIPLPGHAESYNPPDEYLLTEDEIKQMNELDPKDRPYNFIPTKFQSLRHVRGYNNSILERFERCLDLYLCPRKLKRRLNIDPNTLIPKLPKPRELKPFPNTLCLQFIGHNGRVRSLAVSPNGQYLASCSDDCTVRIWEVDTCFIRFTWVFPSAVTALAWNPNPAHHILAAIVGTQVVLISSGTGDADEVEISETLLSAVTESAGKSSADSAGDDEQGDEVEQDEAPDGDVEKPDDGESRKIKDKQKLLLSKLKWKVYHWDGGNTNSSREVWQGAPVGPRFCLDLGSQVTCIRWHHKGDYLCTVVNSEGAEAIAIHQISKSKSQFPFKKSMGRVQTVSFHPSRPFFFVTTQQHIRIYHLIEQKLIKKLLSGCKWLSCMDVHYSGDHVIAGSFDRRLVWFDLDLASTPYKTLKFHEKALRDVQFHRRYPLLASASDDGNVHIFHAAVFNDLTKNPMIVPLKILRGHHVNGGIGVLSVAFHPRQPWVFTAGADGVINLFQDV